MDYVKEGTCGSCKYYEFEGNNQKGYCSYYRSYYWDTDSCKYYEEGERTSGGSACFLTTACCQYKGLPDDCCELTTLRRFRDTYLNTSEEGRALVETYYQIAPGILKDLEECPDSDAILEMIYGTVQKSIALIQAGKKNEAVYAYAVMVARVQNMLRKDS